MRSEPVELLFLHPLPFDGEVWAPLEAAVGDVATYAPTIYSLGENLQDVAQAVLDVVEGRRLIVVGNSIGGSCALEVAAAAPDRVEHLVLVGTKAGHRPEPELRDWALELLESQGVEAVWEHVWKPLFSASTDLAVVSKARSKALTIPADLLVLRVVPDCGHYVPIERPGSLAAILDEVVTSTMLLSDALRARERDHWAWSVRGGGGRNDKSGHQVAVDGRGSAGRVGMVFRSDCIGAQAV